MIKRLFGIWLVLLLLGLFVNPGWVMANNQESVAGMVGLSSLDLAPESVPAVAPAVALGTIPESKVRLLIKSMRVAAVQPVVVYDESSRPPNAVAYPDIAGKYLPGITA